MPTTTSPSSLSSSVPTTAQDGHRTAKSSGVGDGSSSTSSSVCNTSAESTTSTPTTPILLSTYWDEWARCLGSRYQMDLLYRAGRMDSCSTQWRDLQTAIQARYVLLNDPQAAEALIQTTQYQKRRRISPTAGTIWQLKEKPGWE